MPEVAERPNRTKLLLFALILVVLGAFGFWQVRGSFSGWLAEWIGSTSPITVTNSESLPVAFTRSPWPELEQHGRLPIVVETKGRDNPFIDQAAAPTIGNRDERRLVDVKAIRDALRAHLQTYGRYPAGDRIVVGSPASGACLTEKGWEPRSTCVFSVSVVPMPGDPGTGQYLYEFSDGSYRLTFTLEGSSGGYAAGEHVVTPEGIR